MFTFFDLASTIHFHSILLSSSLVFVRFGNDLEALAMLFSCEWLQRRPLIRMKLSPNHRYVTIKVRILSSL